MNHDEHDDLWRLLGKAKEPTVSPFFARNVLRAVREETQETSGFLCWLRGAKSWRRASLGALATLTLILGLRLPPARPGSQPVEQLPELAQTESASPDYAVIGHLDELLACEENSVWLDNSDY